MATRRLDPTCSSNPKPPPSRSRSLPARATCPCSSRPSARACGGPSSASPTARRSSSPIRATARPTRELWQQVDRAARASSRAACGKGDRVGIWAPNRHEWVVTQFATARVGAILVTINPAYQAAELEYALDKAGVSLLVMAPGFRPADYVAMLDASARAARRCATRSCSTTTGTRSSPTATRVADAELAEREADAGARRRDQHPVHLGHDGRAQGRDAHATATSSTTRYFTGALAAATPSTTASACPCRSTTASAWCIGTLACLDPRRLHRPPGRGFEPAAVLEAVEAERCTSLYGVPTMFIAELEHPRFAALDLSSLRTGIMAGAPCPVEVMNAGPRADAHGRGHDRLRHDRDRRRSRPRRRSTTRSRSASRTVGRVHPHVEVKIVDPATGRDRAARHAGRAVHARLQRHARLLGRPRATRAASTPTAGCTPATSRSWTTTATSASSAASRT